MPVTEAQLQAREALPPESYFSESYEEARQKFRWAATAAATMYTVEQESLLVASPDFTMDIAVVRGSKSRGLVIHTSGTHGVEGYAGSAVQIAALHDMVCSQTPPEITTVFVHAVNPYGMAHFRRVNENNVDLNRNALTPEMLKEVLERDPNIAGYEDFLEFFDGDSPPSWCYGNIGYWMQALSMIARYGMSHLKRAMVTGTYTHEKGIFFGGRELQSSHKLLSDYIRKKFGSTRGVEVVWIDVHTGLGSCGVDTLMCAGRDRVMAEGKFPGAELQCVDSTPGDDVAGGYDLTRGFLHDLYPGVFQNEADAERPLLLTQEFGTMSAITVGRALIIENRGYQHDIENHEYWRQYTRDAFYVRTDSWRRSILERGACVLKQAVALSAERSGSAAARPRRTMASCVTCTR
mmetsp:Transcript_82535/g.238492  ORF Transcript_82535/g.238492 Transcript_82535/m.238492 type:complete len:407 (+) Transcript_82535:144-1364(+)